MSNEKVLNNEGGGCTVCLQKKTQQFKDSLLRERESLELLLG